VRIGKETDADSHKAVATTAEAGMV